MPCLLVVLALAVPRLVAALLYVFTDWFAGVAQPTILAVLAFVLLPTTLLWYTAVQHWFGGVWGPWQIAGIVLAVLLDVGPLRGGRRR
jgi:hypothetical protein